jgi:uncharacterized membrane protein
MRILGWCVAAALGAIVLVNGVFMLASPKAWFRLPRLLRLSGSLTEDKYTGGWDGFQVRILGAIVIMVISWFVYSLARNG